MDELAVAHAEFPYCGVDPYLPQSAHQSLLAFAVPVSVGAGLDDRHLGGAELGSTIA